MAWDYHMIGTVHVVGASGRSGSAVARAVLVAGGDVVPVVRDGMRWTTTGIGRTPRIVDLRDKIGLAAVLADAEHVVSCAHARHTGAILAAAPSRARLVLLGSTRRFTRWPDAHGSGVVAGEAALMTSGRPGIMLHPTMIYGARGEDNVQRLARLLRRLPLVPLPDGGRALVQPIYQDDVTQCVLAALAVEWREPQAMVIAGLDPLPYAAFVRLVAHAAGLKPPKVVSFPSGILCAAAPLTRLIPGLPTVRTAEIRRLLEDKAFSIEPMVRMLGVRPLGLQEGLARIWPAVT